MAPPPQIIIIAGPNGAGKSTSATLLVPPDFEFVNADEIAKGLTDLPVEQRDIHAGRIMLKTLDELEERRQSFAVETTLASRTLLPRVRRLRSIGYNAVLSYVWVPTPEISIARVAERVRRGGHNIPEETIQRRYFAGLSNFFNLYMDAVDEWTLIDNSVVGNARTIATGGLSNEFRVFDTELWNELSSTVYE